MGRATKILLIAALFLALPPGATLAACMQSGSSSCCCSDACPKPGEVSVAASSCCEMKDAASLPAPTPPATAPASPKSFVETIELQDTATSKPADRAGLTVADAAHGPPREVPLFTLHAALLI